jgi:GH24 family phage-related lysozyme (muramidase)
MDPLVLLRELEGLRLEVYDDATGQPIRKGSLVQGFPTIGYGRRLDSPGGISRAEADRMLQYDALRAEADAAEIVGRTTWNGLAPEVRACLVALRYQVGSAGFRLFSRMIDELRAGRLDDALGELMQSKAARQTPGRYQRMAEVWRSGSDSIA